MRNICSHLVGAKIYPLGREKGCKRCGDFCCKTCNNIIVTNSFFGSKTDVYFISTTHLIIIVKVLFMLSLV